MTNNTNTKRGVVRKSLSFIIAAIFVLTAALALFDTINAMPLDEPLLYYNDSTWAREDRCPLKLIDGEYYVPLVIFAQLDDTKVRVNNSLNTFVISHSGMYVSFDASTDIATDQSDNYLYIRTFKLDYGERYVPAKTVCKYLGFGYDSYTSKLTGEVAVRITDGTEELSFKELLQKYNPTLLKTEEDVKTTESQTVSHEISSSAATSGADSQPVKILGNRTIYITIDSGINSNTGSILDTLAAYGYKATFFVDKSHITDYPLTLARIISEGHKLGLKPDTDDVSVYASTESFIDELDSTNELLYRVYKIKTRTVRPDALAYSNNELAADITNGVLSEYGYAVWNATVARADGLKANNTATEDMINAIWNNNTLVLSFGSNTSTGTVLSGTLAFIAENAEKCDVRLADSPYTPPRR